MTIEDQIADLLHWVRESGFSAQEISAATGGRVSRPWVNLARDDDSLNPKAETLIALAEARRVLGEKVRAPTAEAAA